MGHTYTWTEKDLPQTAAQAWKGKYLCMLKHYQYASLETPKNSIICRDFHLLLDI